MENIDESTTDSEDYNSPWARFFARNIDYIIFAFVVYILLEFFIPGYGRQELGVLAIAISSVAMTFVWVFIEAVFLSYVGFTPGKALLNVRVITDDGAKIPFDVSVNRALLVWSKGIACGVPILSLFAMLIQYICVRKDDIASWDEDLSIYCVCDKRRLIQFTIVVSMIVVTAISYFLLI